MMHKQAIRACPICGNREVEILHHQRFVLAEGHLLPSELDEVWCAVCGFAFADTAATQTDYDEYYAAYSKYEDAQTSTGGGGSTWDARRLAETAQAIAAVVNREARVLDIGCANGGLLGELKKLGFHHLLGVDPSPACVANCQTAYGIEAVAGSIRQLPATIGQFDVVILSHVLEHVADLHSTVHDLRALLKQRGLAYIEVPDAARYDEFIVAPFQDFNTEHINHFSLSALRNLFQQLGFAAEACGTKDLPTSGSPYPAAFCFFCCGPAGRGDHEATVFEVDEEFHQRLLRYVALSREMIGTIEEQLTRSRRPGDALIVWGTGQLTMKLLAETSLADAKISAFVDGNPINHGKKINGISVIAPEAVGDRSTPILIATLLHHREIRDSIREKLRLPNPLITLDGSLAVPALELCPRLQ